MADQPFVEGIPTGCVILYVGVETPYFASVWSLAFFFCLALFILLADASYGLFRLRRYWSGVLFGVFLLAGVSALVRLV